ncbi:2Fe-2S iron-sulfur cluster-binding protein [soil metagenome]
MANITWITPDGSRHTLDVRNDESLMQAAVDAAIDGIVGECGGSAMCATCHVYVEEAPPGVLPEPDDVEEAMLDSVAAERLPNSRLSCQIKSSPALDGLVVRVPEKQY